MVSFMFLEPNFLPSGYKEEFMAIVRQKGKPDYFITMTASPAWVEVQQNLRPGEDVFNRPDLIARVFKLKWDQLLREILLIRASMQVSIFLPSRLWLDDVRGGDRVRRGDARRRCAVGELRYPCIAVIF